MVLAGPITVTPGEWATLFTEAVVVVTLAAAISAGIIAAAARSSAGARTAGFAAARAMAVVVVVGVLVGVIGSSAIRSSDDRTSSATTTFVPAARYDDEMPFTGDAAAAEAARSGLERALTPLAAAGVPPTPAEVDAALATVLGPAGTRQQESRPGGTGEVTFIVEAAGGCVTGSVGPGAVEVRVGGYIRDGGCIAAVGH